ncbi:MAG: hypothetical protein RSA48_01640 [Bacilli bacterium]
MDSYLEIDSYKLGENRSLLIGIVPFFMLFVLLVFLLIRFFPYDRGTLTSAVVGSDSHIRVLLPYENVNKIIKSGKLRINKRLYNYQVISIGEVKVTGDIYTVEVIIRVPLEQELSYHNSIFKVLFLESTTTIWQQFIKYFKGEN